MYFIVYIMIFSKLFMNVTDAEGIIIYTTFMFWSGFYFNIF